MAQWLESVNEAMPCTSASFGGMQPTPPCIYFQFWVLEGFQICRFSIVGVVGTKMAQVSRRNRLPFQSSESSLRINLAAPPTVIAVGMLRIQSTIEVGSTRATSYHLSNWHFKSLEI